MLKHYCFWFFLLVSYFSNLALADENLADLKYLVDGERKYDIETLPVETLSWQSLPGSVVDLGYTTDSIWVKFRIAPSPDRHRFLLLDYPLIDWVSVWIGVDGRYTQPVVVGDSQPASHKRINIPAHLVDLEPSDEWTDVVLNIQPSFSAVQLPLKVIEQQELVNTFIPEMILYGGAIGVLLVMSCYHLLLFYFTRLRLYGVYGCYVFGMLCLVLQVTGFNYQYLWPNNPGWGITFSNLFLPVLLFFGVTFIKELLLAGETHQPVSLVLFVVRVLAVVLFLLSWAFHTQWLYLLNIATLLVVCLIAIFIGLWLAYKGNKVAKYFSLSWMPLLLGGVLMILDKSGYVSRSFLSHYSLFFGVIAEVVLLSMVVAYRFNEEKKARLDAQALAIENEREAKRNLSALLESKARHANELEFKVNERTRQLQDTLLLLERVNQRLVESNTMDGLTQIRNRKYFESSYECEYERAEVDGSSLALIMIDIDRFKLINDTYGHSAGDCCLKFMANIIQSQLKRQDDTVCRYGGEEFIVVLPNTEIEGAHAVAEKIRVAVMEAVFEFKDQVIPLTISAGVAVTTPKQRLERNALKEMADMALYRAKNAGRNKVMVA